MNAMNSIRCAHSERIPAVSSAVVCCGARFRAEARPTPAPDFLEAGPLSRTPTEDLEQTHPSALWERVGWHEHAFAKKQAQKQRARTHPPRARNPRARTRARGPSRLTTTAQGWATRRGSGNEPPHLGWAHPTARLGHQHPPGVLVLPEGGSVFAFTASDAQ